MILGRQLSIKLFFTSPILFGFLSIKYDAKMLPTRRVFAKRFIKVWPNVENNVCSFAVSSIKIHNWSSTTDSHSRTLVIKNFIEKNSENLMKKLALLNQNESN